MADDERRTSKRSRFDQTEPEPKRASRFDRRSRSPTSRQPETRRSRSPIASSKTLSPSAEGLKSPSDPAAAAGMSSDTLHHPRIMLSRLRSRRSSSYQCPDSSEERHSACRSSAYSPSITIIPPWRWSSLDSADTKQAASPLGKSASPGAAPSGSSTSNINGDMYIADGDYIKDIEVNDLRNKYTLTKGPTQKLVNISAIPTDTLRLPLFAFT